MGEVALADKPYQALQDGENRESGKVWIFPLKLLDISPWLTNYLPKKQSKHNLFYHVSRLISKTRNSIDYRFE